MRGWETSVSEPPTFILRACPVVRGGMRDRHHIAEEPCAVKVASTVLETGGAGDGPAEFNRPTSLTRGANYQRTSKLFYIYNQ